MKPTFKHNVRAFRGINRKEGLVYCRYKDGEMVIARTLPKREVKENAKDKVLVSFLRSHIHPDTDFIQMLKDDRMEIEVRSAKVQRRFLIGG